MPTQQKIDAVAELKERFSRSTIAVTTSYVGMNVAQATALRCKLRENGVEFKVYKNTLATIALRDLGIEGAEHCMSGPTAWAFSKDPTAPARVLKEFGKDVKFVQMMGGVLEGKPLSAAQVNAIAELPSREQLLSQVVGTIAMPLQNLLGALNALPRNLVNALDQIRKQKEEAA